MQQSETEKLTVSTVIIEPVGGSCNLDCGYCYHKNIRNRSKLKVMEDRVLERVIQETSLLNRDCIKFLWHGGEPLLAGLDFYEKVLKFQNDHRAFHNRQFVNHIQTNATLIDKDWVSFIKKNNFRVGTSIDGPAQLHDLSRHDICGNGSFDKTMRGINLLRGADLTVGIMVTINQHNVHYPELIYHTLIDFGLKDFEISPVSNVINAPFLAPEPTDTVKFLKKVFDLWFDSDDPSVYIRIFHNTIRSLIGAPTNDCSFSYNRCREYVAIDEKGEIYSCGRFLKEEKAHLGSCSNDSLIETLKSNKARYIYDQVAKINEECFNCRWLYACGGGCAYQRWTNGGFGSSFPQCNIRKALFEHIEKRTKGFL